MTTMTTEACEFLTTLPEHLQDAGQAWLDNGCDADEATFTDSYAGEWDSFREYAEDLAEGLGMLAEVPEWAQPYFDWDKFTHDLTFDHDVLDAPGSGVYVFRAV